ncbi:uncharacterized protein LOC111871427 [Cryptotermes secundus]|uniref:uncharacterized protein LOC111871427 n=1 Tax=Cryptotermes secundus TaxID=105785 RepID=UPI000CD7BCF6|nr:uncharacterized protein LOC111871427 [Cryptotermes secundus]
MLSTVATFHGNDSVYPTKTSKRGPLQEELCANQTQRDPPHVLTSKPVYQAGETLEANCTSSPARPIAHITWLVNGEPVEESQLRRFPHRDRERLTAQLILDIVQLNIGAEGRLELTCLSTIPAFLEPEQSEYADRKTSSVTVDIEVPLSNSHVDSC